MGSASAIGHGGGADMKKITRRQVLTGAALSAVAGAAFPFGRGLSALASVTVGPQGHTGQDALIVLFLRGGADGLNVIIPHGDDDYYRLRPTLALPRPNNKTEMANVRAVDLDGFFGLHPALAPLYPLYKEGKFAPIHAVGSGDQTRSHFEAMATMERGLAQESGSASGWVARHLATTSSEHDSPLRAVAVADTMPDSLRGATNAVALLNLNEFRLNTPASEKTDRAAEISQTLRAMYGGEGTGNREKGKGISSALSPQPSALLSAPGSATLDALDAVKRLDPANYRPAPGANYPVSDIGNGLRQVACLVKGEVGLEVAFLEMGGWDTHVAQGRDAGFMSVNLGNLGKALAAFAADLGPQLNRVTLIVMTEFGRRAYENFSLGTDHGRGSVMLTLGGNVNGGKVHGEWPGLAHPKLEGPGDLHVTTDYRDVLAEALTRRIGNPHCDAVFSGYKPNFRNVFRK